MPNESWFPCLIWLFARNFFYLFSPDLSLSLLDLLDGYFLPMFDRNCLPCISIFSVRNFLCPFSALPCAHKGLLSLSGAKNGRCCSFIARKSTKGAWRKIVLEIYGQTNCSKRTDCLLLLWIRRIRTKPRMILVGLCHCGWFRSCACK